MINQSVENQWNEYSSLSFPGASPESLRIHRLVFYAGAAGAMSVMIQSPDLQVGLRNLAHAVEEHVKELES